MSLQFVYIILGILGWYWWLRGGENKSHLLVSHAPRLILIILGISTLITTYGMTLFLQSVNDSAPLWDALTTVLSLAAQFLLTKKYIENWYSWIIADIIYIFLYFYKDLYLTGILYAIFLIMCIIGLKQWQKSTYPTNLYM